VAAKLSVTVRPAREADLGPILEIYNREVLVSTATYDTVPRTTAEHARWFAHHGKAHPVIVAEVDGVVRGWASLSPWSDRAAYARSVEVSVYVAEDARRRGIGALLLSSLVEEARRHGHHALLARISADNAGSIALHAAQGFFVAGTLREVGVKFGRVLDVCLMELLVGGAP
jgi:phosphinothricin acetyltransferase